MKILTKLEFEELVSAMKIHLIRVPDHETIVSGLLAGESVTVVYNHQAEKGYVTQGGDVRSD